MKKAIVFRSSADATITKLFGELCDREIVCLIQSSLITDYRVRFPHIKFIDIKGESFYNLKQDVISEISQCIYDELYILFTGTTGHNYGNILAIADEIQFREGFFYNCLGEKTRIYRPSKIIDILTNWYVFLITKMYKIRES